MKTNCNVCFRRCRLEEGQTGACGARKNVNGTVTASNYGRLTALALDPIEKKPLARFFPGSNILSVGSYGCSLRCPFCQNYEIASAREENRHAGSEGLHPVTFRDGNRQRTVRDTARLFRLHGMRTVLVSNGMASKEILCEILPYIDAMNIDLKGFTEEFYRDFLGGDLAMVKDFIAGAAQGCHVELTKLIIPDKNDSEEEMREMTAWIASLCGGRGREIPLHVSRYFPRYKWKVPATRVETVYRLADVARETLKYVYTGNC